MSSLYAKMSVPFATRDHFSIPIDRNGVGVKKWRRNDEGVNFARFDFSAMIRADRNGNGVRLVTHGSMGKTTRNSFLDPAGLKLRSGRHAW